MKNCLLIGIAILTFSAGLVGFGEKTLFLGNPARIAQPYLFDRCAPCMAQDSCWQVGMALSYQHSFASDDIARFLFGGSTLSFSGSRVKDRSTTDILADYFGLPADFRSCVSFSPRIVDLSAIFHGRWSLNCLYQGIYCAVDVPVVVSKWDLKLHEVVFNAGTAFHPAGYMSSVRIDRSLLADDVEDYLEGTTTFGDVAEPLRFGKIFGRQNTTRVADLTIDIGWHDEWFCHAVGFFARIVAPTSNRPRSEFLFEAIAGSAGHWQVGVGGNGWLCVGECLLRNHDQLTICIDGWITHLFDACQRRSFDLKNGPGSRYMLLERLTSPSSDLLLAGMAPEFQYLGRLTPAINYTTFDTTIAIAIQAQCNAQLSYECNGYAAHLGYSFWVRTKEKIKKRCTFAKDCFALKGDAQLYGFKQADESAVLLNATQSQATINVGQGTTNFVAGSEFRNANADDATLATDGAANPLNQLKAADAAALGIAVQQVHGSNPAQLLSDNDINSESAVLPRALLHTLFSYVSYQQVANDSCLCAHISLGGNVSFATPSTTHNSACSRWGVSLEGGVSF